MDESYQDISLSKKAHLKLFCLIHLTYLLAEYQAYRRHSLDIIEWYEHLHSHSSIFTIIFPPQASQSSNIWKMIIMLRIQYKIYQAFRPSSYYQTQKNLMCNPNTKVDLYNENCNIITVQSIQMCWWIHPFLPVGKTNYKVSYLLDMDSDPWYLVGTLPRLLSES